MKYEEILEEKRRMDFNLTEHETLIKLVKDAQIMGEKAQKDMERLRKLSSTLAKSFEELGLLRKESDLADIKVKHKCAVGVDGSFQLVGGVGGKWYAPISVVRVIFSNGLGSKPKVDIFWAGIKEIQEQKEPHPDIKASMIMLSGESKALLNWGASGKEAMVFVDGPIVDPPFYGDKEYVKDRCEALGKCLQKSLLIGCVKRSRDKFYIEYLINMHGNKMKNLEAFPSDQHLMLYIFTDLRYKGYSGPIFTRWIDISNVNSVYKTYKENDVYIASVFFQANAMSQVLRLDVPFSSPLEENISLVDEQTVQAAKAASDWTYPGQDYPLPVFLAHEKCNIREGCAEVLYDEIITRSTSVDPRTQTIIIQLR